MAGRFSLPVPPPLRSICPAVAMLDVFVDSMASVFILRQAPPGFVITNPSPGSTIEGLSGNARVQSIGTATMYVAFQSPDGDLEWVDFDVTKIHIVPDAGADLYATRVMRDTFGARHQFEAPLQVSLPSAPQLGAASFSDTGNAFVLRVGFGPARRLALPSTAIAASNGAGTSTSTSGASIAQSLLWHRLGFPHDGAWRHVTSAFVNHGQPPLATLTTNLVASEAVMRGRARMLPFVTRPPPDRTLPPPGAVLYMDFCGPMIKSHPHRFTVYSGIVDAGSSYGRAFPAHQMTKEVARATYDALISDLSSKLGLTHKIKPQIVVSDQGSAYISHYFREFLAGEQVLHRLSSTYTPEQNPYIERMWGVTFSTARVLLAAANLPPTFHPYAIQTSQWIHNRLPMPSRGNRSPFTILTRQSADLAYLRSFGCLCHYTIPPARRDGDKHFADRGAVGLYLGPSEESPASIVYVPASRTVTVSRNVVCYEDRFPGVHGVRFDWFPPLSEEGASTPSLQSQVQPLPPSTPSPPTPAPPAPSSPAAPAPSPPLFPTPAQPSAPPHASPPPAPPSYHPTPSPMANPPSLSSSLPSSAPRQEGAPPPFVLPSAEAAAPLSHPQANDPHSNAYDRHFHQPQLRRTRQQPDRLVMPDHRVRQPRAHSAFTPVGFTNPLTADDAAARANFGLLALSLNRGFDPLVMYSLESTADVSNYASSDVPLALRADVRSTADMGEVAVPRSYKQAIVCEHASYWREAIAKEIAGLVGLDTWTVIAASSVPAGSNIMNCHFVFDLKRNQLGEIEKFKARLVADGNTQQYGVDFDRVFSTVVKLSTIRIVLAIAAVEDYNLSSIDIRQAYLQAELKENLYMRVPPGHPRFDKSGNPLVLKLNRSLYGLKQAGREWNKLLVSFLLEWGFVQSMIDVCLFMYNSKQGSILWLLVWVDDIIHVDNDTGLRERFVAALSQRFPTEDKGALQWILGMRVLRDRKAKSLVLSQELYVADLLNRFSHLIESGRRYTSPMDDKMKLSPEFSPEVGSPEHEAMQPKRHEYMSIVGGILWLANVSRFDLAFAASQLARFVSNPGELHFAAAVRVLLYLNSTSDRVLTYSPSVKRPFEAYVDSDWSVKFSASGALFFYMGSLVHWFAKTQRSVSFSSAESEIFGAILAAKEGIFIRELLADLCRPPSGPTRIFSDSKSCVDLTYDPVSFKKTKHILRAANGLRDYVARDVFVLVHIAGSINLADILTKAQAVAVFNQLMQAYDAFVASIAHA